ncbi:13023_t:CDS:2, partial [Cetraspora pellucida]
MTAQRRGDPDFLLRTIDSNHPMFDKARSVYANNLKAQNFFDSIEKKVLRLTSDYISYIALVALYDGKWKEMLTVIYNANLQVPKHCGIFVGTGKITPDIILQNCFMGKAKGCKECTQALVMSKVLLMYHIGYNTYTSPDRVYKKQEFQCGWRHPF